MVFSINSRVLLNASAQVAEIDLNRIFAIEEAVDYVLSNPGAKFCESVDITINLDLGKNKKEKAAIRGSLFLSHGNGKIIRIIACSDSESERSSLIALGVPTYSSEDFISEVRKDGINCDVVIASTGVMRSLGVVAKILGPKGLMPSPKSGTVAEDIVATVGEIRKGKSQFKADVNGVLHIKIGNMGFEKQKVLDNIKSSIAAVNSVKPAYVKGIFIKSIYLKSTMGKAIRVALSDLI